MDSHAQQARVLDPFELLNFMADVGGHNAEHVVDYILQKCDIKVDEPQFIKVLQKALDSKSFIVLKTLCIKYENGDKKFKNAHIRKMVYDKFKNDLSLLETCGYSLGFRLLPEEYSEVVNLTIDKTDFNSILLSFMINYAKNAPQYLTDEILTRFIGKGLNVLKAYDSFDNYYFDKYVPENTRREQKLETIALQIVNVLRCLDKYHGGSFSPLCIFRLVTKSDGYDDIDDDFKIETIQDSICMILFKCISTYYDYSEEGEKIYKKFAYGSEAKFVKNYKEFVSKYNPSTKAIKSIT